MGINGGTGIVGSGSVLGGSGISLPKGGVAPFVGLLDEYPNAAASYSVRLLKSDYAGSAMEVRRSSDNALQDIGFDANGDLDTASLLSFVGAGDGFVRTWYDQSGNASNLQQTTTSNQPKIVSSGSVLTVSGKPVLDFDGINDVIGGNLLSPNVSLFANLANLRTYRVPLLGATALSCENLDDKRYWWRNTIDARIRNGSSIEAITTWFNTPYIISIIFKSTAFVDVFENGGSVSTQAVSGSSNTSQIGIGGSLSLSRAMDMAVSEAIFWGDESTARQVGVHTNQNTYYSIY